MSLIAELKRRNVFRVGAAYAVVGWLIIEVTDTVFPHLGLPGWSVTLAIALVIIGFPLAVFLAWAFELTPEGVKRTEDVPPEAPQAARRARRLDRWIMAGLAGAIVLLVAERLWIDRRGEAPPAVAPGERAQARGAPAERPATGNPLHSIAVLPFDNYSPDASDAYFANGITEEITSQLSRLSGLRVMSRTAVSRALEGGQSLGELAEQLGVGSVLEGSVRKAGDSLRITTKLIDAQSNELLWSRDFDRDLADVFEIQRDVALAVAVALRAQLTPRDRSRMNASPTANVAAYQLYLRSSERRASVPELNRSAIELLRQAVALDPKFVNAWSALAWRYQWETWHGDQSGPARALEYSAIALELDPQSPDAHAARAAALVAMERNGEARAAFARALALDPELGRALSDGGMRAAMQGDLADGLRLSAREIRTSPNVPNVRYHVGYPLLLAGDDRRLAAWLDLAAAEGMLAHRLDILRIMLAAAQGRSAEALAATRAALKHWKQQPEFREFAADVMSFYGEPAAARAEFESLVGYAPDTEGSWLTGRTPRTNLAFVLHQLGERDRAARLFEESLAFNLRRIEDGSDSPFRSRDVAAILAVRGDVAGAVQWLERSYAAGNRAHRYLAQDPMFASLRGDRRFQALLERMAEAASRERERIDSEGIAAEIDALVLAGASH